MKLVKTKSFKEVWSKLICHTNTTNQHTHTMDKSNSKAAQDLTTLMETTMQQLSHKFQATSDQIVSRMEEMGTRINDLEKNVADLMRQAGMDECQTGEEMAKRQ
ncbi:uncharacterized protein LOC143141113 [Alosa pseudoharengus]|uniref:uncharacterized protein LOC143141113 n=1 Tax=Alosa pseudoharengus TaxID=34774 RepID=UPI003F8C7C1D